MGVPSNKLLLGISFYGQSYTLASSGTSPKIGARALGAGSAGPATRQSGMLSYYEICSRGIATNSI